MYLHPDDLEVTEILRLLEERRQKGVPTYYKPLDPKRREIIREWYLEQLPEWCGDLGARPQAVLVNSCGTIICRGYTRIVIGDYGAFVEFDRGQCVVGNLTEGWGGRKYNWLRTRDRLGTKVYEQLESVSYADYRPGMYYVSPRDVVRLDEGGA